MSVIASVLIAIAAAATQVPEVTPPIRVQQRVAPVLKAYADLLRRGENVATETALGSAVLTVLRDKSEVGDEALAVLLGLYVGDHDAEDIVCELINRGKRVLGYLAKYQSSQVTMPSVSAPMAKSVKALYPSVISRIRSGQTCVEEP
jgi:hypothetical protein